MMWNAGEGMGWWMLAGSVWFVFFWAVVIWAVVKVTSRQPQGDVTALEIVQKRYARGEISRAEFEQLRKDLAA